MGRQAKLRRARRQGHATAVAELNLKAILAERDALREVLKKVELERDALRSELGDAKSMVDGMTRVMEIARKTMAHLKAERDDLQHKFVEAVHHNCTQRDAILELLNARTAFGSAFAALSELTGYQK